jgi:hypothetical protein
MKARARTLASTALFLAVAGGAVALAWFGIAKKDETAQAKKTAEEKLYAFAPAKVRAITVEAKGETTRLARTEAGWRVESPLQAEAERAAADALVDKVAELRRKAAIAAAPDTASLARYGLSQPRARVALTLDDGKVETLALGDESSFDGSAFVRTTGGGVELVAGDVRWSLERTTFDLREKRLLPFDDNELQRVDVTAPRLSYTLVRDGDTWRLDAPAKERADDATAARVLSAIRGLRATAFLASPQGDRAHGLDKPRWKVRVVAASGAPRTLLLGEARRTPSRSPSSPASPASPPRDEAGTSGLYAKIEGARELAVLPDGAAKDLDVDLFALRDKSVMNFDREKVAAAKFTVDGSSFDAKFDAKKKKEEEEAGRLASLLWTLSSLKAKAFVDETGRALAEHGLDHPAREVALLDQGGKELDRLLVSADRGGKTFARALSSPRIVEIDPAALASLPKSADELQEKPPEKPPMKAEAASGIR